ncbi:MAG: cytochrome c [Caldimonas sp.]
MVALLGGLSAAGAFAADDAAVLAQGKQLFMNGSSLPACALCHTLSDAGASGAIGPNLDELQPDGQRVAAALRSGIGVMPSYRAALKDDQIAAIAKYVSTVTAAGK